MVTNLGTKQLVQDKTLPAVLFLQPQEQQGYSGVSDPELQASPSWKPFTLPGSGGFYRLICGHYMDSGEHC